ncbi:MAG: proton-conducting transporter membrane subunit [Elusimicrobiota bacterium]
MYLLLSAVFTIYITGLLALGFNSKPRLASLIGSFGAISGSLLCAIPVVKVLFFGKELFLNVVWSLPFSSFYAKLDALSAIFLLPLIIIVVLASFYGVEYVLHWHNKRPIGSLWFFYNFLVASMIMVLIANNAILFLVSWEIMSIVPFFLITFEAEKEGAQKAGLIYLIATHLGTGFIFVVFILLSSKFGVMDFDKFFVPAGHLASIVFILSIIGFGTKAGFFPFHVWLPHAHSQAPSHVSALMSGIMIKIGIYGILRTMTFFDLPELWWGVVLICVGLTGGIFGILFALVQRDIKRILAYSSVENIGIIAVGLGVGVIGISLQSPVLIVLGFSGVFFHIFNHAIFKGLLFLSAGAVVHASGIRDIDRLGGLLKKLPVVGACFFVGSAAICGLPPLNGFMSEYLIYFGSFKGALVNGVMPLISFFVIVGLALIGGLAVACFTKVFGIVFLGEPRNLHALDMKKIGYLMKTPIVLLGMICFLSAAAAPFFIKLFNPIISLFTDLQLSIVTLDISRNLINVELVIFAFFLCAIIVYYIRRRLIKNKVVSKGLTWDCGYEHVTPRMQYTSSSFVQPIDKFFSAVLRPKIEKYLPEDIFPKDAGFVLKHSDTLEKNIYTPFFNKIKRVSLKLQWFQYGYLQLYVLYILLALIVIIVWKLV